MKLAADAGRRRRAAARRCCWPRARRRSRREAGYGGVGPNFLPWLVAVVLLRCAAPGWSGRRAAAAFARWRSPRAPTRGHWPGFVWVSAGLLANAALITTHRLHPQLHAVLRARGARLRGRPKAGSTCSLRALVDRRGDRLRDRGAGVLDVHQAAGDQPAGPHRHRLDLRADMDIFNQLLQGFATAGTPINLLWCLRRLHARHGGRRAARHRPGGGGGDAAADHAARSSRPRR